MQGVVDRVHRRVDIAGAEDAVDTSTLGGRMAFARMRKNLTQKELAERIQNKQGKSKSRATIVQYEGDNILPPLDVVALIAAQLDVSASYIAFGDHVVEGIQHQDVEMISFPEISFGKDGQYVSSTMAYSKANVEKLGVDRDSIKAYVLPHDAPAFDLSKEDSLIVDASVEEPTDRGGLYVIKTRDGMELIRVNPNFAPTARRNITFVDPRGTEMTAALSDLHFLGAVVSTVIRTRK